MNNLDNLRDETPEFQVKKQETSNAKKNLIVSFVLLDVFIFILIAGILGWIDFIDREYLIFGGVFFIVIQLFYIITQVIKINRNQSKLN